MYILLGSHDTERILTRMGNNLEKTKLAYLFQFAYPGVPALYYGDEIGLVGGKDPGCRGAFLWEEAHWNTNLRDFIKVLIRLRKEWVALRRGDFIPIISSANPSCYAFARMAPEGNVLVAMNPGSSEIDVSINVEKLNWEDGKSLHGLLTPLDEIKVENRSINIHLPAFGGVWLG
jgi:glycosidase